MDEWKIKRKARKLTLTFKRLSLQPAQSECFCCLCWGLSSDYTEKKLKTQREKIIHIKLEASHLLLFLIILHHHPLLFLSHLDYLHQKPELYAYLGLLRSVLDWIDIMLRHNGEDSNSTVLGHCRHWDIYWQKEVDEKAKESAGLKQRVQECTHSSVHKAAVKGHLSSQSLKWQEVTTF